MEEESLVAPLDRNQHRPATAVGGFLLRGSTLKDGLLELRRLCLFAEPGPTWAIY